MDRLQRLYLWLTQISPGMAWLVFFIIGIALLLLSAVIGNVTFAYELITPSCGTSIEKEVGYFWAFNWSIGGTLLGPLAVWYVFSSLNQFKPMLTSMVDGNMFVTIQYEKVSFQTVYQHWLESTKRSMRIGVFIFTLTMVLVGIEFYHVIGEEIIFNVASCGEYFSDNVNECDWSIASVITSVDGNSISRFYNFCHSLWSYIFVCGFPIALIVSFFGFLAAQSSFFNSSRLEEHGLRFIPNVYSNDRRCGFELFETFFEKCVAIIFITVFMFYLMHLQNTYLRSCYAHIMDIIIEAIDIAMKYFPSIEGFNKIVVLSLHDIGSLDITSLLSAVFVVGFSVVLLVIFYCTLREAAKNGRVELKKFVKNHTNIVFCGTEVSADYFDSQLKQMRVWPLKWIKLNLLIGLIIISFIFFIFYRLAVFVAGGTLFIYFCGYLKSKVWNYWKSQHEDD